jgi:uncharacterized membrane protein YcaP (DUF421 family)
LDAVLRAAAVYFILLIAVRLSGRRTLSELTTFDFILVLVISEAVQQGMVGDDYSLTTAMVVVVTLVLIDVTLSFAKTRFRWLEKILEGVPTVLVENGRPLRERMKKARVSEDDIMESARELQGLERMDEIKFAVLEVGGKITIIPAGKDKEPVEIKDAAESAKPVAPKAPKASKRRAPRGRSS